MDEGKRTVGIERAGADAALGGVGLVFTAGVNTLHGIVERGGGVDEGIVNLVGGIIEERKAVSGVENTVGLIEVLVVGSRGVDLAGYAPEVTRHCLLLLLPAADLLAGPFALVLAEIGGEEVESLVEITSLAVGQIVEFHAEFLTHEEDVDEV